MVAFRRSLEVSSRRGCSPPVVFALVERQARAWPAGCTAAMATPLATSGTLLANVDMGHPRGSVLWAMPIIINYNPGYFLGGGYLIGGYSNGYAVSAPFVYSPAR